MKFQFKKLLFFALAICFLASCSTDEETPAPTISLVNPPSQSADKDATLQFTVKATALEKIDRITITQKVGSSTTTVSGYPKTSNFTSATEDLFVFGYQVTEASGSIELNFSVTDKKGKMSATSFVINVNPTTPQTTPMVYEKTGAIIANKIGPDQSAWDLATNVRRAGTSNDADMVNPSTATNPWIKGWDGVRSTTYVKANSFDYTNATVEAATAAFSAGTASGTVRDVAVNDIYIAKIKGGSQYAVIKITVADNDIASSNAEKIEFTYKKLAENSGQ